MTASYGSDSFVRGLYGGFIVGALVGGGMVGAIFWPAPKPPPPAIEAIDIKHLDALEIRVQALEKLRSMSITTGSIDIAVYPVENMGRARVAPSQR